MMQALKPNHAEFVSMSMRKRATPSRRSRLIVARTMAAIVLVLNSLLQLVPNLAAQTDDASKVDSLNKQVIEFYQAGKYQEAIPLARKLLDIREKLSGPEHSDTATSLNSLALLNMDLGKTGGALEFAVRAEKAQETQLGNILSFTSEQQRLEFQETTTNPFRLLATLGSAPDIAQALLHKGVMLDSLLEDRLVAEASRDAKRREVIDELRAAKQRLLPISPTPVMK
jgi:tetratricopeptide repeat protein